MSVPDKYIPALSYDRLTPVLDPVLRWSMRELELKRRPITQAPIERGQRVLDLSCGTATLTILLKQTHPAAHCTSSTLAGPIIYTRRWYLR